MQNNFDVTSGRHKMNLQRHECNVTAYVTIFNYSSLRKPASAFRILKLFTFIRSHTRH